MNLVIKAIEFFPALQAYLRGVLQFNSGNFEGAKKYFEECMTHPSFNNELVLSYYGQTLCALGFLEEGHGFLLKACEFYEASGWQLKESQELQVAQGTLTALHHISKHTDLEIPDRLLRKKLNGPPTM